MGELLAAECVAAGVDVRLTCTEIGIDLDAFLAVRHARSGEIEPIEIRRAAHGDQQGIPHDALAPRNNGDLVAHRLHPVNRRTQPHVDTFATKDVVITAEQSESAMVSRRGAR